MSTPVPAPAPAPRRVGLLGGGVIGGGWAARFALNGIDVVLHDPDPDAPRKVAEVLDAAFDYAAQTGRRISIEYALIRDVNDQPWRADLLGRLLHGKLAHVNLIPLNPTPGSKWDASPKPVEREFVRRLREAGVATTVRDTRGREIDGACGQLAASELTVVDAGGAAADAEVAR